MGLFSRKTRTDSRPLAGGTTHASAQRRSDGVGQGWVNQASGMGSELDRQAWTEYTAGCPLSPVEIDDLTTTNAVARRLARRPVEDSMRAGFTLKGEANGQIVDVTVGGPEVEVEEAPDPIESWSERFGVTSLVVEADSTAKAHGLALWVFGTDDGAPSHEPLDFLGLRAMHWVRVVSRRHVSVAEWGRNPASARFGRPIRYQISFPRTGLTAVFHWTRVVPWVGVELTDEQQASGLHGSDGGGSSIFDLVWSALKGYGVSHQHALEALSLLTQGVWSNDQLQRAVDAGNGGAVAAHYENSKVGGGLFGDYVAGQGESYAIVGRPVQGIADVVKLTRDALVVASSMPEPVILGAAPSSAGLNNDTGGLIRAWYDHLQILQPTRYGVPLARFYQIASRALNGPTGGVPIVGLSVSWPSLWQLTDKERAEVRKLNAEARSIDLGTTTVSPAEARTDKTLATEYQLAPESVVEATQPEAALEDIELADDEDMPAGESPISIQAAGQILGFKSSGSTRGFILKRGVPLFRPGARYQVYESHIRAAMRESRV